ncbi:D-arabinono-1,4-lactone oxidase [Bryobacter aggregatus]|uniref:D-arabinono-1,4-lactone oxidase n=1 Tax=Bryobacter aggregatus TaxID=360054 RepID=UPI0004E0EC9F|nr:D-arabinono-1,4-lactone oxidase [Bryobacter aggregatus]
MRKRTFLKLLSNGIAAPAIPAFSAPPAAEKITNWAGNLTYSTTRLKEANSVDQVRSLLASQEKWKVLGSRHCFNTIADSRDNFLSLPATMDRIAIDERARTVTVDGSLKYGQLSPVLEKKGFALHNLASLPHISIAGACSTATHGSGETSGNLATAVSAIEFVSASGEVVQLSRKVDGDTFPGAVVGLGALGVITRVTLDLQPNYTVKQYVYQNLPFSQLQNHFDAIEASGYSVSLFTDWKNQLVNEVWIKDRSDAKKSFAAPAEFYGARRATRNLHPIAELSAENCTEQMGIPGPWYERLPHFRMGFTPSAGKELQSEYFVPREHAVDAILAVERLKDQVSPHLMITEIRTIAADDLWMSPCYKRASVAIHFTWKQDWESVRRVLPQIEKALSPYQVRPHWGKLFTIAPKELQAKYARLPDFVRLANKYDPKGKFRNDFLNANIFGS